MTVTSFTYLFDVPAASPPASGPGSSVGFPGGVSQLVCDGVMYDQAHFLEMFDRTLPAGYLQPLKGNPDAGYEIFQAYGAVGAAVSAAMEDAECGLFNMYATGGDYATCVVTFIAYGTGASGAITVKAETVVSDSESGHQFYVTQDAVLTLGVNDTYTGNATVKAVAKGYDFNIRGPRVSLANEVLPGGIDTVENRITSPAHTTHALYVFQVTDATGGEDAWLDGHGANRGLTRATNESDGAYRLRIRNAPDTVSLGAVTRLVSSVLGPLGISFQIIETWSEQYQTCWDAPSPNVGTPTYQAVPPTNPDFDTNTFVYDDPRTATYRNRWLDELEYRGVFIVVLNTTTPLASDVAAAVAGMYFQLQAIKAGGVAAIVDTNHVW